MVHMDIDKFAYVNILSAGKILLLICALADYMAFLRNRFTKSRREGQHFECSKGFDAEYN